MSVKTICVVIFDANEAEWLIEKTSVLALALDAHVIGVHPYTPFTFISGIGAEPIIYPTIQDWEESASDEIRDLFEQTVRKNGIRAEFRRQSVLYGAEPFVLSSARGADLVLMGTNGSKSRSPDDRSLAARIIRNLGRPVLVLSPETTLGGLAERITIGWSETREATRAAHDALAIAKPGASIELVSVLARAGEETPGFDSRDDFAAALDRRGYVVTTADRIASADSRAEELLKAATESGADLLVAGAFGHSNVYDLVVGAVTPDLLDRSPLPVLLSR